MKYSIQDTARVEKRARQVLKKRTGNKITESHVIQTFVTTNAYGLHYCKDLKTVLRCISVP